MLARRHHHRNPSDDGPPSRDARNGPAPHQIAPGRAIDHRLTNGYRIGTASRLPGLCVARRPFAGSRRHAELALVCPRTANAPRIEEHCAGARAYDPTTPMLRGFVCLHDKGREMRNLAGSSGAQRCSEALRTLPGRADYADESAPWNLASQLLAGSVRRLLHVS